MVGYAEYSAGGTYRMYMYKSKHVVESRDVVWADWEPKTVKDKMPGMFGSDLEAEEDGAICRPGIDEQDWIDISWLDIDTDSDSKYTHVQRINALPVVQMGRVIPLDGLADFV